MARAKKSKSNVTEREGQEDPRAPLDSAGLLSACQAVLKRLETDLLERAKSSPEVTRALEARYQAEKTAERTAESFAGWAELLATQVAAAWVLSCVFVRTLEDRGLLKQARLAGPGAEDSQRQFFQLAPSLTERDYLLSVFRELAHHPAAKDLFDAEHSLVWKLSPSADVAKELLALFRSPSAEAPAFRFGQVATRFLGDLYQHLSEDVRKRYALLQTPEFVDDFILERTLEPAIVRFGLDDTTLIDPTCGSGHFLLDAFDRLFEHRLRAEPGIDPRVAAVKALDAVYGVDINPYAVAIARFRLTLSFLGKAGYARISDAPMLPMHLVVADSLLHYVAQPQTDLEYVEGQTVKHWRTSHVFALHDEVAASAVLNRKFAAVVGNPPYITVVDRALRAAYRDRYKTATGEYPLSVPFLERFFGLARARGFVGQITNNSFAKKAIGKVLVEQFLTSVNVSLVANMEGARIPGHSTPTLILVGNAEPPSSSRVQVVLNNRNEPRGPEGPGPLWTSFIAHWNEDGYRDEYITTNSVDRDQLATHPWALNGGPAALLLERLERDAESRLGTVATAIGFMAQTNADECFLLPRGSVTRFGVEPRYVRRISVGGDIRDWQIRSAANAVYPYEWPNQLVALEEAPGLHRFLWPFRPVLESRATFSGSTYRSDGLPWWKWHQVTVSNVAGPSIVFAETATHNHFSFTYGNELFKKTAPVIKIPPELIDTGACFALLAYLNSSLGCLWMKQHCPNKGSSEDLLSQVQGAKVALTIDRGTTGGGGGYEFSGQFLKDLPIPASVLNDRRLALLGRRTWELGVRRGAIVASIEAMITASEESRCIAASIVGMQEEIDWTVYVICGLVSDDVLLSDEDLPSLALGDRPFEIALAREHGNSDMVVEGPDGVMFAANPPSHLTERQRVVWERRIELVPTLDYIETYAAKRRYLGHDRESALTEAIEEVALSDVEAAFANEPSTMSALLRESRRDFSDAHGELGSKQWLCRVVATQQVPYLSSFVFQESGLAKLAEWDSAWGRMREQHEVDEVMPNFSKGDFREPGYWSLRGPVNVPNERFISYPLCESDNDGEPVYGWFGWDHLQRAKALWSLYVRRRDGDGWTVDRLTPMLTGLLELIPWVKQWHNEPSVEYGGLRMGDNFADVLAGECQRYGLTHDDLRAWRPPKKSRSGKTSSKAATKVQRDPDEVGEDEHAEHIHRQLEAREHGLVSDKHPATKPSARRKGAARRLPSDETAWVARIEAHQASFLQERGAKFHDRGDRSYVTKVEDNVLALSAETRGDLDGGSGNELGTDDRPGKILAPWSSSALAVNVFEHWRHRDAKPVVRALGTSGSLFPMVRFEARFPTGVRGGPANLDVVLEDNSGRRIALESKFLEPFRGSANGDKETAFSTAYFAEPRLWAGIAALQELALAFSEGGTQFTRLDAPQLIKHILALRHAGKPFELVHLWYRPEGDLPEVKVLEQEIDAFRAVTDRDDVRFRSMTYQELFARLCAEAPGEVDYLAYLRNRYFTTSTTPENL